MALDIGAALKRGFDRTFERNGLILMAAFVVFKLLNAVVGQTLSASAQRAMRELASRTPRMMPGEVPGGPTPFALDVPLAVAVVLFLLMAIVAEVVFIVAVRTLVSEETETVPREFVRRRIVGATAHSIVGGVVVAVLVATGFLFLVIPGIFLAISFFFVRQEIAVADKGFIEAMRGSWGLARGNRIELFALVLVILIAGFLAGVLTAPLALLGPGPVAVASSVVDAVFTVFGVAVAARAYDQLRSEREEVTEPGALGPDEVAEFDSDPAGP